MKTLFVALLASLAFAGSARAQDPPAECGPAAQLSAEFSANVAAESRCFELRMYTFAADGDDIDTMHQRLRDGGVALFERLGANVIAAWQRLDDPNTMVWMLAYRDRAHRDEVWAAFGADPVRDELNEKYGVSILRREVYWMSATDYSKMR